MLGPELQWGQRENNSDGFTSDDFRVQFSAKYNFKHLVGRQVMKRSARRCVAAALVAAPGVLGLRAPAALGADAGRDPDAALKAAYAKYKDLKEGANADYIPALAKVDSKIYGIALVTADGKVYTAGDIKSEVSIQSISKVFTHGEGHRGAGPGRDREDHRRRRHRHALQLDRRGRVAQKALGGPR